MKQSLERLLTDPCPYCSGTGTVKSTATICFDILSELRKVTSELNGHGVLLRVNPEIAKSLQGEEQGVLRDLERTVGRQHPHQGGRDAAPRAVRRHGGLTSPSGSSRPP